MNHMCNIWKLKKTSFDDLVASKKFIQLQTVKYMAYTK